MDPNLTIRLISSVFDKEAVTQAVQKLKLEHNWELSKNEEGRKISKISQLEEHIKLLEKRLYFLKDLDTYSDDQNILNLDPENIYDMEVLGWYIKHLSNLKNINPDSLDVDKIELVSKILNQFEQRFIELRLREDVSILRTKESLEKLEGKQPDSGDDLV
jgi:hypothetical protein